MASLDIIPNLVAFSRDPINFYINYSTGGAPDSRFAISILIISPGEVNLLADYWQYGIGYQDISSRLNAYYKEANIHFPTYGISVPAYTFVLKKYDVGVVEYYNGVQIGTTIASSDISETFVIHGGTSFDKVSADWLSNQATIPLYLFLTTAPQSKRTIIGMPEFLTFLYSGTPPANFKTHVTLTYTTGGTTDYLITTSTTGGPAWSCIAWRLPCSYSALNIAANATGIVWYYDIVVEDNSGNPLTESKRFVIDRTPYHTIRKLVWRNSRGGEDSFYFTGNEKFNADYTHDSSNNYTLANYAVTLGQRSISNKLEQANIKTGAWLESLEIANWLRDLRLSQFVYEDDGTQFLPIEIPAGSANISDAEKTGFNIELEYSYRFKNHSYTP